MDLCGFKWIPRRSLAASSHAGCVQRENGEKVRACPVVQGCYDACVVLEVCASPRTHAGVPLSLRKGPRRKEFPLSHKISIGRGEPACALASSSLLIFVNKHGYRSHDCPGFLVSVSSPSSPHPNPRTCIIRVDCSSLSTHNNRKKHNKFASEHYSSTSV